MPPDRELGYELVYETRSGDAEGDRGRLPDVLPEEPRGDHRRPHPRRRRSSRSEPGQLRSVARRAHVHRSGRAHLRAHHGREHQAPLRDHPRQARRERARSSRRGSPADTRRSRSARTTRRSSSATRKKLELVLRSGALARADHAVERAAHRAVARSRRDSPRRFRALSPAAGSCSCS